ncbi:MAG: FixH family protein [Gammaproteobacteria bacterium]|nr:FixH family protein [Gammaproteobacteria bacterium]
MSTGPRVPWYGHPWVWLLIAIPGLSVVGGIAMIVLATGSPNDLVRDDYYKAGLAIDQDLSEEQRAADLGITLSLETGPRPPAAAGRDARGTSTPAIPISTWWSNCSIPPSPSAIWSSVPVRWRQGRWA